MEMVLVFRFKSYCFMCCICVLFFFVVVGSVFCLIREGFCVSFLWLFITGLGIGDRDILV